MVRPVSRTFSTTTLTREHPLGGLHNSSIRLTPWHASSYSASPHELEGTSVIIGGSINRSFADLRGTAIVMTAAVFFSLAGSVTQAQALDPEFWKSSTENQQTVERFIYDQA